MTSTDDLAGRVAALEAEVAQLKAVIENAAANELPWWKKVAGSFADDPTFDEAMRLGREYREAQRPEEWMSKEE